MTKSCAVTRGDWGGMIEEMILQAFSKNSDGADMTFCGSVPLPGSGYWNSSVASGWKAGTLDNKRWWGGRAYRDADEPRRRTTGEIRQRGTTEPSGVDITRSAPLYLQPAPADVSEAAWCSRTLTRDATTDRATQLITCCICLIGWESRRDAGEGSVFEVSCSQWRIQKFWKRWRN